MKDDIYYTDRDGYTDDSRQRDDEDWADALARQITGTLLASDTDGTKS